MKSIIKEFGNLPKVDLPILPFLNNVILIMNPWWISGFVTGEGSFTYSKKTSKERTYYYSHF